MPEVINRQVTGGLPVFPAGKGKGGVYSPLPNDVKEGKLRAHAMQTILVAPHALYELWHDVESAPLWMEYLVSVNITGAGTSHWVFGNPEEKDGKRLEFDSEVVADEPGVRIAWKSITEGIDESGEVTFKENSNGRGTLVTLREFDRLPGGAVGNAVASLTMRSPNQMVIENLRHFKQLAESGEIPSVEGQPSGPRGFSGSLKSKLYGQNNPTPPGTSSEA